MSPAELDELQARCAHWGVYSWVPGKFVADVMRLICEVRGLQVDVAQLKQQAALMADEYSDLESEAISQGAIL